MGGASSGECGSTVGPNAGQIGTAIGGTRRHGTYAKVLVELVISGLTSGKFYIAKVRVAGSNPVVRSKKVQVGEY